MQFFFIDAAGSGRILRGDKEKYRNIWNLDDGILHFIMNTAPDAGAVLREGGQETSTGVFTPMLARRQRLVRFNPGLNYIALIKFFRLINIAPAIETGLGKARISRKLLVRPRH